MLWDKLTEENYVVYINRDIDLKIKVFELMENDEIYIKYKGFNLRVVEDIYKGNGPLSGIHSALMNSTTNEVLCIACDMPLITKETLNVLGNYDENYDVLIPKVLGRLQPLCAVYSKKIIPNIEEAIRENNNKLQLLIKTLNYKVIEGNEDNKFIEKEFLNINTEKEYHELEEL